jgi:NAD(P)-dependent dehydrogenase (short-subunit alcohol dehydrogenase family)
VFDRHGHVDVVIANAGIVERKEFLDDEVEDGELKEPDLSVLNVNLVGCMFTGKLALWWFKKNPTPGGALIMISSVGGYADGTICFLNLLRLGKGITLYKASKHGVSLST